MLCHFSNPQLKHGVNCEIEDATAMRGLLIRECVCDEAKCDLQDINTMVLRNGNNKIRSKFKYERHKYYD